MKLEHKTGLLYRVTVCFNWDPSYGPLEALRTYQLELGECVLDADTGALVGDYKPLPARDLTKEQTAALLGDRLAAVVEGITVARAAAAKAKDSADKRVAEVEEDSNQRIAAATAQANERANLAITEAKQRLAYAARLLTDAAK